MGTARQDYQALLQLCSLAIPGVKWLPAAELSVQRFGVWDVLKAWQGLSTTQHS